MSDYNDLDMMIDFYNPQRYVDGCKCEPDVNHTCELCRTYNVLREAKRMLMVRDAEIEQLREENQLLKLERDELVRHEERMHSDIGVILGSDTSLVDAAARAVTEIKRLRDQHDTYVEMVEQLTRQLDAAACPDGPRP